MTMKINKCLLGLLIIAPQLFVLISSSRSHDKSDEERGHMMASQGGSSQDGGWDYRCGCGSSSDGSWNYGWGVAEGPGGSTISYGSGSGHDSNGDEFGYGWGSSSSPGSDGSSVSNGGVGSGGFGFGGGSSSNNGNLMAANGPSTQPQTVPNVVGATNDANNHRKNN